MDSRSVHCQRTSTMTIKEPLLYCLRQKTGSSGYSLGTLKYPVIGAFLIDPLINRPANNYPPAMIFPRWCFVIFEKGKKIKFPVKLSLLIMDGWATKTDQPNVFSVLESWDQFHEAFRACNFEFPNL